MPRIRSIKPSFFTNEDLAELSFAHRLCFAGLWCQADREGRLEDRPRRLKPAVFPYDDVDMDGLLAGLAQKGFITRYVADGVACIEIRHFLKHQRPKSEEQVSVIPARVLENPRGIGADRRGIGAAQRIGGKREDIKREDMRREERGKEEAADGAASPADGVDLPNIPTPDAFVALWNETTHAPIARCRDLTTTRRRRVRSRLTERSLAEWELVFAGIQRSSFCRGENDRGWAASFDWVIGSPDVAVKVLEGTYDDRHKTPRNGDRPFTAKEVEQAREWRRKMGRCPHEPECDSSTECLAQFIRVNLRFEQVAT